MLRKPLRHIRSLLFSPIESRLQLLQSYVLRLQDTILLLEGLRASRQLSDLGQLKHLSAAEFKVYSQWGEDGILEWLLQRLPACSTRFIEFGVEDYREANTRFLLISRNWRGLVMDGNAQKIESLRQEEIFWRHDLTAKDAFIDRENINRLILDAGFGGDIGVLSIDIDGNDYWVWEAIDCVNPDIVVCEYNAVFGDVHAISIPYDPSFVRAKAHFSHLFFGASIAALVYLARNKGYELIGTNHAGCNAFFLCNDHYRAIEAAIDDKSPRASLARESRDANDKLNYLSGLDRLRQIRHMSVIRVDDGTTVTLDELGEIYSQQWLRQMGAQ